MTSALRGEGGQTKRRCSNGGCVNSVLQISPKCGQGGRGPKSRNFCGRHIWMVPQDARLCSHAEEQGEGGRADGAAADGDGHAIWLFVLRGQCLGSGPGNAVTHGTLSTSLDHNNAILHGGHFIFEVPQFCQTALPFLPDSHQLKENWADTGTPEVKSTKPSP